MRLILASASPRRAELLAAAGVIFDVMPVDVDERTRLAEAPDAYVRRLAQEKSMRAMELAALAGALTAAEPVVLGADTAVVIDGDILGKPLDDEEARTMLRRLSGRRHEVLTGVSLRSRSTEMGCVETTAVFFTPLGDGEVDWYVQSGEGLDKAGSYAIQGLASRFIQRIEGSYSNVVGLPIAAVHRLMTQMAEERI
jgi:septum formation protein